MALLAAGAVTLAIGCSAMISADLGLVNCSNEGAIGPPACPVGKQCRAGICATCAPHDVCGNNFDDDCNGLPDDGCGVTGGAAGASGGSAGTTGGGGSGGVAGVLTGGGTGGVGGTGGLAGSGGGGTGGALGSPCSNDTECPDGAFCSPPSTHGATGTASVCVMGCCTTAQCGAGEVCYAAKGGYGICLPIAATGRPAGGSKATGSPCTQDSECRSGICDGGCIDTCCSDFDCTGVVTVCRLKTDKTTGRTAFMCGTSNGTSVFPEACTSPAECASNACLTPDDICTKACCAKKDCNAGTNNSCTYANIGQDTVRVCAPISPGSLLNGAPCTFSTDCKSGWCIDIGSGGFCSDTCCQDADCGDAIAFACRTLTPVDPPGSPALLFCVKR